MSDNTFIQAEDDPMRVDPRFRLDFPSKMSDGRQLTDYRSICLNKFKRKRYDNISIQIIFKT